MSTSTITRPLAEDSFLNQFEVVKHVTLPVVKLDEDGTPVFVMIKTAIEQAPDTETSAPARRRVLKDAAGNPVKNAAGEVQYIEPKARAMEAPDLCEVINLRDGKPGVLVVNAQIRSDLKSKFPDDTYVDKAFQIRHIGKNKSAQGFTYRKFEIIQLVPKPGSDVEKMLKGATNKAPVGATKVATK